MRDLIALMTVLGFMACSSCSGNSGPAACVAAGGRCVLGGTTCSQRGTADCDPERNPGGAFCCLSCSGGRDAAAVCE